MAAATGEVLGSPGVLLARSPRSPPGVAPAVHDVSPRTAASTPLASATRDGGRPGRTGGQSTGTTPARRQPANQANGALVTVAASPAQAIALVHAAQTGTLYAGLRGKGVAIDRKAVVNDTTVLGQ